MFALPEILWSPVGNFYYELSQTGTSGGTQPFRYNFLQNSDNLIYLKLIILLQLIGLLSVLFYLIKNKYIANRLLRDSVITLLVILSIIVGFVLYFAAVFSINIM